MASTGSSSSGATPDARPAAADLVVGVTSHGDAETTGAFTAALRETLADRYGGQTRILLVETSTGDRPATVPEPAGDGPVIEIARPRAGAGLLEVPYHGVPGKGRTVHAMLVRARELEARACVIVDAGERTTAPPAIEWLAGPVLEQAFDFVSAYYQRHPLDGALTKGIVYPLLRALYGPRLRHPASVHFACSRRLVDELLDEDFWDREGANVGIDLWLTTAAAAGDFRLAEASLGVRPPQVRREPPLDLATTVAQVVGSIFADMETRAERWQRVRGSLPVQQFGAPRVAAPPPGASVEVDGLIESCRLGYRELRDLWTWVLPPRTIVALQRLLSGPTAQFRLPDELWARIVYDFALAYRLRVLARDHLLRSLVPLYLGWLASFAMRVRDHAVEAVDQQVDDLAQAFESEKPYLIAGWRWPERRRVE